MGFGGSECGALQLQLLHSCKAVLCNQQQVQPDRQASASQAVLRLGSIPTPFSPPPLRHDKHNDIPRLSDTPSRPQQGGAGRCHP